MHTQRRKLRSALPAVIGISGSSPLASKAYGNCLKIPPPIHSSKYCRCGYSLLHMVRPPLSFGGRPGNPPEKKAIWGCEKHSTWGIELVKASSSHRRRKWKQWVNTHNPQTRSKYVPFWCWQDICHQVLVISCPLPNSHQAGRPFTLVMDHVAFSKYPTQKTQMPESTQCFLYFQDFSFQVKHRGSPTWPIVEGNPCNSDSPVSVFCPGLVIPTHPGICLLSLLQSGNTSTIWLLEPRVSGVDISLDIQAIGLVKTDTLISQDLLTLLCNLHFIVTKCNSPIQWIHHFQFCNVWSFSAVTTSNM